MPQGVLVSCLLEGGYASRLCSRRSRPNASLTVNMPLARQRKAVCFRSLVTRVQRARPGPRRHAYHPMQYAPTPRHLSPPLIGRNGWHEGSTGSPPPPDPHSPTTSPYCRAAPPSSLLSIPRFELGPVSSAVRIHRVSQRTHSRRSHRRDMPLGRTRSRYISSCRDLSRSAWIERPEDDGRE